MNILFGNTFMNIVGRAEEQWSPAAVTGPEIIGSAIRYGIQYGIRTEWRAVVAPKGATTQQQKDAESTQFAELRRSRTCFGPPPNVVDFWWHP